MCVVARDAAEDDLAVTVRIDASERTVLRGVLYRDVSAFRESQKKRVVFRAQRAYRQAVTQASALRGRIAAIDAEVAELLDVRAILQAESVAADDDVAAAATALTTIVHTYGGDHSAKATGD